MIATRIAILTALGLLLATPSVAQNLRDRLNKGAEAVRQGTTQGAAAMREGAAVVQDQAVDISGKVIQHVDESIDSSVDLLTNEATPEATRAELDTMSGETLARLFAEQPDAATLFQDAAGYAVFDTRKLVVMGAAVGAGRGVAVSATTGDRVYMNMGTGGVGLSLGIGGFETQVVILFQEDEHFHEFVTQGYDATADAGSMFGTDKASLQLRYVNGRAIFYLTKQGWKVSATAAGTRYWIDANLN